MPQIRVTNQSGSVPTTSQLEIGDIGINTYDGKAFLKKKVGVTQSIVELVTTSQPLAYASFYSTEDQPITVINTPQPVRLNSTHLNLKINLSGSGGIVFNHVGVYQLTYVAEVSNDSNALQDATFWIKYNNVDFPNSSTLVTLPGHKNPGAPSTQLMTFSLIGQAQNDNDKIELWWQGTSTDLSLQFQPLSTYPATPSVIANIASIR